MKPLWTVAKREVQAYFVSVVAYVVLGASLLWSGLSYWLMVGAFAQQPSGPGTDTPLTAFFGNTLLFFVPLLVLVPVITMRVFAGEKSSGTIEQLMTAPVSDRTLVLGKYLATLVFWAAMWLPTLLYVWITSRYGDVDLGAVGASYLGIFGMGLYYLAIGVLMSVIAPNQIVAAVLTFGVTGALFMAGIAELIVDGTTRDVLGYISVWSHMADFSKGIVDSRYLVFDASMAILALFFAVRVLESRRNR